jgi:hypothetical protein
MEKFLKVYLNLKRSKKLTSREKFIISEILSFQSQGLRCIMSNLALANELGVTEKEIRNSITKLNKLDFFQSKREVRTEGNDLKKFGKLMSIDENKLQIFLKEENINSNESNLENDTNILPTPIEVLKIEEKAIEEDLNEVIQVKKENIQPKIKEIKTFKDLVCDDENLIEDKTDDLFEEFEDIKSNPIEEKVYDVIFTPKVQEEIITDIVESDFDRFLREYNEKDIKEITSI